MARNPYATHIDLRLAAALALADAILGKVKTYLGLTVRIARSSGTFAAFDVSPEELGNNRCG
jgi:hypothetical protein